MLFILVCTEGNVSEPSYLEALSSALGGQAPHKTGAALETIILPLGGNHGHNKIIQKAEEAIAKKEGDQNSILSLKGEDDTCEKWLLCDYDDMEEHGANIDALRQEAEKAGYTLIVSKPNFETFVLMHFLEPSEIAKIKPKDYVSVINSKVAELNKLNEAKGYSDSMKIPPYSKKKYAAPKFFGLLLGDMELVEAVLSRNVDLSCNCYSEMPKMIQRLKELE